jgi:hypothetical protein
MPEEPRGESADLVDYEVLDSADTLAGPPGDDPLDRGVITPQRWSAGIRFGATALEQRSGGSLSQRLARENPDNGVNFANDRPDGVNWDENATDADIVGQIAEDGPMLRAGRLVRAVSDQAVFRTWETDAVARDLGIDGGGATAEEAALHSLSDPEAGPA